MIRDEHGEFEIGDPPMQTLDEQEEGEQGEVQDDES